MLQPLLDAGLHPNQMKQNLENFIEKIQQLTAVLQIDLSAYQLDHIAMRINELELAKLAHKAWTQEGEVISQTQINGRPIIVIAFKQPLMIKSWHIECLELPYPAEGKIYPEQSWEHVEFVVPSEAQTADDYLAYLKQMFPDLALNWDNLAGKGVKVKLSSPKGEGERLNNPTVAFKWQGVCIKLHPHSLKNIVESEQ
ncbi:VOC family protein [Vibrio sp. C8]